MLRNSFEYNDKDETRIMQNMFALLSIGKYTL
jgi:hypothetical protein